MNEKSGPSAIILPERVRTPKGLKVFLNEKQDAEKNQSRYVLSMFDPRAPNSAESGFDDLTDRSKNLHP